MAITLGGYRAGIVAMILDEDYPQAKMFDVLLVNCCDLMLVLPNHKKSKMFL